MEEVNACEKNAGNGMFATLYAALYFCAPSFKKSLKFFRTSIASLNPETVELPSFYMLSTMFKGARGPPEKVSLTLAPHSNILRVIVNGRGATRG